MKRQLEIGQILRFGGVGIACTALYFGLGQASLLLGFGVQSAHLVAYAVSLLASYLAQKRITFGVRRQHGTYLLRFAMATAVLGLAAYLLVVFLEDLDLAEHWIISVNTLVYPAGSFLMHHFWTFRDIPRARD